MAQYVYPAIFHPEKEDGGFSIFFPDFSNTFSQGEDMSDGMSMANDALSFTLYDYEKENLPTPIPTPLENIRLDGDDFAVYIFADTAAYHRKFDQTFVTQTVSIPQWLSDEATKANINFSQLLQNALKLQLDLV